jgi:hypothetical protein
MTHSQTTIIQARELESYWKWKNKELAKQYPNDFELGNVIRKLTH